jgi:ribosomal protein S18 acetylase RimI-like enzyme
MTNVLIRNMTIGDLAEVSKLALLANPHAVEEEYKRHLRDLLENQPDLSFVAVMDGRVVGYVQADVHYKCASAIPFYYKFGFRIAGFQQDYFGAGHDAIILKLEL